jgi:hypothetical protein
MLGQELHAAAPVAFRRGGVCRKEPMKKIVPALIVLALVAGGLFFWLSSNIDGLIKSAIETYGSDMTRASVKVGAVKVAPADGKGAISNLSIGNPAGFKTAYALKAARIEIDIDLASVAKDVIVIRRINVVAPDVIYENGATMTNFDALQKNIASYLGTSEGKGGQKLIVDRLTIVDGKAEASAEFMKGQTVSVPLPNITLRNLGRAKGGVTAGELGQEVIGAVETKLKVKVNFDSMMQSAKKAAGSIGNTIKGLFK